MTAVDLDLDVIRRFDGSWFVDDEDEFAEHQVSSATRPSWWPPPRPSAPG